MLYEVLNLIEAASLVVGDEALDLLNIRLDKPQPLLRSLTLDQWRDLLMNLNKLSNALFQLIPLYNPRKEPISLLFGLKILNKNLYSLHQRHLILFLQLSLIHNSNKHIKTLKNLIEVRLRNIVLTCPHLFLGDQFGEAVEKQIVKFALLCNRCKVLQGLKELVVASCAVLN